jgi:hypothetical protein
MERNSRNPFIILNMKTGIVNIGIFPIFAALWQNPTKTQSTQNDFGMINKFCAPGDLGGKISKQTTYEFQEIK